MRGAPTATVGSLGTSKVPSWTSGSVTMPMGVSKPSEPSAR